MRVILAEEKKERKKEGALTVGDFGGNLVLVHHRGLNVGFQIKEKKACRDDAFMK